MMLNQIWFSWSLLCRWKTFTRLAKDERLLATTRLQALARAMEAKKTTNALRRERWARTMIGRQASSPTRAEGIVRIISDLESTENTKYTIFSN